MLSHQARVVHVKHDADGALSVLMRCCEDASTDQWHTLYVKPDMTDQQVQDWIAKSKSLCQSQHGARERARDIINRGLLK